MDLKMGGGAPYNGNRTLGGRACLPRRSQTKAGLVRGLDLSPKASFDYEREHDYEKESWQLL